MTGMGTISFEQIKRRIRAADYLSVAQLFLQDNFLLKRPLKSDDIKPRLLGHWGTCPGINIIYANLKAFFGNNPNFHIVIGPGHGFPALQANLFLDGELEKVDEKATRDEAGIAHICRQFSWPGGYPSHASPITPGVICEGGELGYALATAYGFALKEPEKRIAVIIGDGELETATALSSLNLNKLISSKTNGRVLPILHLNGYKISAPTVSARKSERELFQMLRGFGFTPLQIDGPDPELFQEKLIAARTIFAADPTHPPFLILKTEKGLTGPTTLDGQKIAGNYLAHQIPLKDAKTNPEQLAILDDWLRSYRFDELFNTQALHSPQGTTASEGTLTSTTHRAGVDMETTEGNSASCVALHTSPDANTFGGTQPSTTHRAEADMETTEGNPASCVALHTSPDANTFGGTQPSTTYCSDADMETTEGNPASCVALRRLRPSHRGAGPVTTGAGDPGDARSWVPSVVSNPGTDLISPAKTLGSLLASQISQDQNFYLFSPDETTSNKLDEVYNVSTRSWAMPTEPWDLPESESGQIVELLSENTLFAVMLGHLLAGHQAMMTSYESFFTIITSQVLQHLKFLQQSSEVDWRPDIPSANLLSTSTCWRQDHNGFTHQSPALISMLLDRPGNYVNCLFPVDDVAACAAYDFMLNSKNVVNLTTFNKTDEPRWIDGNHAKFQFDNGGASIFGFVSDENPDIIITAAGDIVSREALYAIRILKQDLPDLKIRFVGINALTHDAIGTTENHLKQETFNEYYSYDKPIFANFHGYPDTLKHILGQYTAENRLHVHGFIEQGTTTTPLEMLSLNHASRYDLAMDVASYLSRPDLVENYQKILDDNHAHALAHGLDLLKEHL